MSKSVKIKKQERVLFNSGDNASYLSKWVKKTLYAEKAKSTFIGHLDFCWKEYWKDTKYWGDNISGICSISDYAMAKNRKSLTKNDVEKAKSLLNTKKIVKKQAKLSSRKQKFIKLILPAAKKSKKRYGVPISVTLAQAAEETGWGDFVKNNNYFGIKGKGKKFTTHEEIEGERIKVKHSFRLYNSAEESVLDHGKLLSSNPRYRLVFKHKDNPFQFVDALYKAGYATNSKYANNLKRIIKGNKLYEYDGFEF
ncbi:MAG: glucosaminidase domain-containing protein [Deltaproteobacteria bacterium]|nr:glucosaminidase domain-containing protein [Deltaproteobacteria bacterium]